MTLYVSRTFVLLCNTPHPSNHVSQVGTCRSFDSRLQACTQTQGTHTAPPSKSSQIYTLQRTLFLHLERLSAPPRRAVDVAARLRCFLDVLFWILAFSTSVKATRRETLSILSSSIAITSVQSAVGRGNRWGDA